MPSTCTSLHYHLVFATNDRAPLIEATWRPRLHEYLGGVVHGLDALPSGIGGVADHVHLLVSLKATHCLSDFMRELKKASSAWAATMAKAAAFRWQEGYSAFTVSAPNRTAVQAYIAGQEEHHRHRSFQEELCDFLRKAGIDYDQRHLE